MVTLEVLNQKGQHIKNLFSGNLKPGYDQFVFDGTDSDGTSLPSGIYFIRMQADHFIETKKMILLK